MSAREEILSHLVNSLNEEAVFTHEAEYAANKLIDDLLHEEAEDIRTVDRNNAWEERKGVGGAVLPSQVADYLDPYVK